MEERINLMIRSSTEEFLIFKIQEGDKEIQVRYDKGMIEKLFLYKSIKNIAW